MALVTQTINVSPKISPYDQKQKSYAPDQPRAKAFYGFSETLTAVTTGNTGKLQIVLALPRNEVLELTGFNIYSIGTGSDVGYPAGYLAYNPIVQETGSYSFVTRFAVDRIVNTQVGETPDQYLGTWAFKGADGATQDPVELPQSFPIDGNATCFVQLYSSGEVSANTISGMITFDVYTLEQYNARPLGALQGNFWGMNRGLG